MAELGAAAWEAIGPAAAPPVDDLLAALRRVLLLAEMPAEELDDLRARGEEVWLEAGDYVAREGTSADWFFILLDGEILITKRAGGEDRYLDTYQSGTFFGEVPILIGSPYVATGRATRRSRVFRVHNEAFVDLIFRCEWTLRQILRTLAQRVLNLQAFAQNQARLLALGTLAAGLAHELNNPAAAARSAAAQLRGGVDALQEQAARLGPERLASLHAVARDATTGGGAATTLDPLAASEREEALAAWLDARGVEDAWDVAPDLVAAGLDAVRLAALVEAAGDLAPAAIAWLAASLATRGLLETVEGSVARVSRLVGQMEAYTFLDQAPVQEVDLREGLESTLAVLAGRIGRGVTVERDYDPAVPPLEAHGGELNQVWTNLLANALDAVGERGRIRVRTRCDGAGVLVEIADDGPGIPSDIRGRIFEPFFTTKEVGQGTGLGLDLARRIVELHHGDIRVESAPGDTRFHVRLPLAPAEGEAVAG